MKSLKKAILFGFFIWLIAFSVAFLLYPIHDSHCPLFESIMPVVISLTTVFFTMKYFRNITKNFQKEGFLLGVMIICVNWGIDLLLFLPKSPMQMSLSAYIQDIGITYFMILPITFGFGIFLEKK
ncbi:hypothetical protein HZA38_04785 [Candidatus Peregrinibacteria bacterium]|nr:hypothetical protein [Candidatus Peregrinibacteria bacterium]